MQSQAGLTLLELMIALTLGLLLLTGIGTIYIGSNQTYRVQEQNARIQESGRYALDVIGRSVRQAGYWNIPINPVALQTAFGGTPISGANGAGTAADTVTVQYDGGVGDRDCEGNNVTAAMVVQDVIQLDAANFELECDGNAEAGGAVVDPQPLVSNVEDLQFLYGIDTTGDQSADRYVAAPGNWNQVVTVRACVLIRSEERGITTSAQSFLTCANALSGTGTLTAAGDSRLRRTFVATFNLRNRVTNLP
jgi:type IV pilus assembly protein PilW